jgi:hypothetical protein
MKPITILCLIPLILITYSFAQTQDSAAAKKQVASDTTASISASAGIAVSDSLGSSSPALAPVAHKITMFATSQFDSVLSLLSSGDSIKQNHQIVGIGSDQATGEIVIIVFDKSGNPLKLTFAPFSTDQKTINNASVQQAIPTKPAKVEQNGRTWFILETTGKSAFTYTSAYGTILSSDTNTNGQVIAGLSLLTIGGMLYGSYAFTKNMELGYGKVALMNYGSTALGSYYPIFLSLCIANATEVNERRWYTKNVYDPVIHDSIYTERPKITDHIRAWTSMIGFPLGIYLGSRLNIADKDAYGKVALMEYFSQTFGALAFALPVFYYDHPFDSGTDNRHYLASSSALTMCMLPAGFYGGYWLGRGKEISAGRGTLPWVTGSMGSLTGLGFAFLGDEFHGIASVRAILASTIAGYAGGTWLGLTYHPQIDYAFWQSVFIGASSAAGAAVGVAFPLIANANNRRAYILFSIAGGWSGFFLGERLSLALFEKSSRDKKASSLRLDLPGLTTLPVLLASKNISSAPEEYAGYANAPAFPIANLEWKF